MHRVVVQSACTKASICWLSLRYELIELLRFGRSFSGWDGCNDERPVIWRTDMYLFFQLLLSSARIWRFLLDVSVTAWQWRWRNFILFNPKAYERRCISFHVDDLSQVTLDCCRFYNSVSRVLWMINFLGLFATVPRNLYVIALCYHTIWIRDEITQCDFVPKMTWPTPMTLRVFNDVLQNNPETWRRVAREVAFYCWQINIKFTMVTSSTACHENTLLSWLLI